MATFYSQQIPKRLRHRGLYEGKEQSVSGTIRVIPGQSLATTDLIQMLILGENVRPESILVGVKKVNGTPVLTNPSFSVGVTPLVLNPTSVTRPDGTVYPPLVASTTVLGTSTALGADNLARFAEPAPPTANTEWGPYIVTLTPSGAGAFSVAGGDIDLFVEIVCRGELTEANPIYSEFNSGKFKN